MSPYRPPPDVRPAVLALALALALVGAPALAHHGDTLYPYLDASGHFRAGLVAVGLTAPDDGEPVPPAGVGPVNLASFPFAAHPCHPGLQMILDFAPENASAGTDRVGIVVPYRFQIELFDEATGERLPGAVFSYNDSGSRMYGLPSEHARGGPLRVDLYMTIGAEADWNLSIRGWLEHEGCVVISEVEANPLGGDAGNEWIELGNLGFGSVDLSGWTIRAHHGTPSALTLPAGTVIDSGGRLVVAFPSQFLDNKDEVVTLEGPDGAEYSRTPALTDEANDSRTNQLTLLTGADWAFAEGTPGQPY